MSKKKGFDSLSKIVIKRKVDRYGNKVIIEADFDSLKIAPFFIDPFNLLFGPHDFVVDPYPLEVLIQIQIWI